MNTLLGAGYISIDSTPYVFKTDLEVKNFIDSL